MVELVWHALVHSSINLDVDVIADPIRAKVGRESDVALLPEGASEEVPRSRSKTMTCWHLFLPPSLGFVGLFVASLPF